MEDKIKHAILNLTKDEIIIFQILNNPNNLHEIHEQIHKFFERYHIEKKYIVVNDKVDIKTISYESLVRIRDTINKELAKKNEKR